MSGYAHRLLYEIGLHCRNKNFNARQNRVFTFENMIKSHFQATRPECKTESYRTTGIQKKIHCFTVDEYCKHCETVFETMGCNFLFLVMKLDLAY